MKTYSVLFAEDVPYHGTAEIEAADDAGAVEAAKACDVSANTTDPDWNNGFCKRIVYIQAENGELVDADIPLDDCFVRYGGEPERILCDAAAELLRTLRTIAAIPLWGESICAPGRHPSGCGEVYIITAL